MRIVRGEKGIYLKTAVVSGMMLLLIISSFYALQKPVAIEVDGNVLKTQAYFTDNVEEVLEKNNITVGPHDSVEPSMNFVVKKGQCIIVTRANKVIIIAGDETREIITTPVSITEAIQLAGFQLGPKDIIKTQAVLKTVPDQIIEIIKVVEKQEQIEETISFETETIEDNTLEKGLSKTLQEGKNGIALSTVTITYQNGVEVNREVICSDTLVKPVSTIVAAGNITSISRGNDSFKFNRALYMDASAYTYTGNNTATGLKPAVGLVAVDPAVIPLGSKLYIEGYGYATAADTGGAIKGNRLDVFMEDRSQCLKWGRRTTKVYVLD